MVVGAFPAAKLGILALKQISKPIANVLKNRAKNSPFFRNYVCMPPAQFYNWVEVKTKMWAMNLGKPMKVPQLNEAMAIELGANLLGEFVIFSIGAGLLVFEYVRQVKKEAKREEQILQEKAALQSTLNELAFRVEKQDAQLREFQRMLYGSTEHKSWFHRRMRSSPDSDVSDDLKDRQNIVKDPTLLTSSQSALSTPTKLSESSAMSIQSVHEQRPNYSENKQVNAINVATVSSRTL